MRVKSPILGIGCSRPRLVHNELLMQLFRLVVAIVTNLHCCQIMICIPVAQYGEI